MRSKTSGQASESGETLIEVLLASALMATVVLAIVGGISTMLIGSTLHRQQANANLTLTSAMEKLKVPGGQLCPVSPATLPAYAMDPNISLQNVEYQTNGKDPTSGNPTLVWSSAPGDCGVSSALSLQRITLRYSTGAGSRVTPKLSFVKGDS
jgi:Tfp pilus assembly protein PilV